MKYKKLPNTDLKVSLLCLGTMTYGEQNNEKEAHEQLDYSLSNGVNFIDTAEMYAIPPREETQGKTEEIIGTWLSKRKDRDKIVLATKVAGPGMEYLRGGSCLNKKHIFNLVRDEDLFAWKFAKKGFFKFKENIPKINQRIFENYTRNYF